MFFRWPLRSVWRKTELIIDRHIILRPDPIGESREIPETVISKGDDCDCSSSSIGISL
ncbi:hypothetical protein Hanom_Chr14g01270241 [Helianthus anomalus]